MTSGEVGSLLGGVATDRGLLPPTVSALVGFRHSKSSTTTRTLGVWYFWETIQLEIPDERVRACVLGARTVRILQGPFQVACCAPRFAMTT